MDELGVIQRKTDAAVGFALAERSILGAVCVGIPASQPVEDGMEVVACGDSGRIEDGRRLEILIAIGLGALVVQAEAAGRRRCGALADRAEDIPSDCYPVALRALIDVDQVFFLVDEDQVAGVAAVALGLLVHAVDIRHSSARADLVTVDRGVGRNGSVRLDIVHGIAVVEPALGAALLAVGLAEVVELLADADKAPGHTALFGGIQIVVIIADLAVTGQDLADAHCSAGHAAVVGGSIEFEPLAQEPAVGIEAVELAADLVDAVFIVFSVHIVHIVLAGFDPAVFGCVDRYRLRSDCRLAGLGSRRHNRHAGHDHDQDKQHSEFFLHKNSPVLLMRINPLYPAPPVGAEYNGHLIF